MSDSDRTDVTINLLGPMRMHSGRAELPLPGRKPAALMAYLCHRVGMNVPRETLSGLLWGDVPEAQARASLRQALSALRKALGGAASVLVASAETIRLDERRIRSDLVDMLRLVEANGKEDLEQLAAQFRGEFLEGFGAVTPEFDRWLDAERGTLRSRKTAALIRLADLYARERRYDEMITVGQMLLQLDPLQEHVHRRVMKAYQAQGRYDAALRQYASLESVLARELGVAPEALSTEIAQQIRRDRRQSSEPAELIDAPGNMPASTIKAPARPSIAVLHFRGLPKDSEAEFLGEGISEDVTVELSRVPDILVVSRQSALRVDEETLSAKQIGAELGVRFYLSGSVRVAAGKLRVAAHLVSCETGHELWAERFDRELMDVFDIQAEIARTVAATTADRIAASVLSHVAENRPDNLESYELVLKGIAALHRFSEEGYLEAQRLFELAIQRSPDYGRAHGWLAMARLYLRWNIDASVELSDVVKAAERAVSLDPTEPKGHLALGMCLFIHRQYDQAEFRFQAALRANPNDELVLTEYGRFLMYLDQSEAGLQRIREAMRVNPFFPDWFWSIQGRCLHTLGRFREAALAFERIHAPPFYIHAYLAACYVMLEDRDRMNAAKTALFAARPDFDLSAFKAIFPYKNPETADRYFESLEAAGL
ncbi:BTAD domain-containing putative transcriptional regulator [Nioella sp.]|uniref:BTAD domain-containing putative transcriptional regulator n=1 Tax=Nioella sp. TaxID=1912091 RepID=UPI003B51F0DC